MAKGTKKEDKPLYRAVRFEIFPTPDQVTLLCKVSTNLTQVWNEALKERQDNFNHFFWPIYEKFKKAKGDVLLMKEFRRELQEAFKSHNITLFDQINALTGKRAASSDFAAVPRNWQEETLDSLNGSFSSFLALRKAGDIDARPPQLRIEGNFFYKIPGRYGFKFTGDQLELGFGKLDTIMIFSVPAFQREKLDGAIKLKKFELYRDERNMGKPGRWWISIAYEVQKPKTLPVITDKVVYLAIGASRLGVISLKGEFCLNLPRPDYHWKPNINVLEERIQQTMKGSRRWKKRMAARARMFAKLGHQQKQHGQYEVVQQLLSHGIHFVVTELKVRSKQGALADATKPERGGSPIGANWSAQNTGNIGRLIQKLTDKASECGGSVIKCKLPLLSKEERHLPNSEQRKILIAKKLREEFLAEKKMN